MNRKNLFIVVGYVEWILATVGVLWFFYGFLAPMLCSLMGLHGWYAVLPYVLVSLFGGCGIPVVLFFAFGSILIPRIRTAVLMYLLKGVLDKTLANIALATVKQPRSEGGSELLN